ncbi:MAG: Spx/MgsR family RNA polymerase-binding regulatory protein [Streptococcaceae bacterium]|nr:Spx/MgsR family RNA polymerase-binding regulatory protein [Streptococcaceae bacterium]
MIKVYTVQSCSSCKKAVEWMQNHELDYEEINLITGDVSKEDFLKILSLTEEGTEDIISTRSQAYKRLKIDFDTISMNELLELFDKNRTLLRRPLIVDDKRLQVGYNEDDVRKFLPRKVRRVELEEAFENVRQFDKEREEEQVYTA